MAPNMDNNSIALYCIGDHEGEGGSPATPTGKFYFDILSHGNPPFHLKTNRLPVSPKVCKSALTRGDHFRDQQPR